MMQPEHGCSASLVGNKDKGGVNREPFHSHPLPPQPRPRPQPQPQPFESADAINQNFMFPESSGIGLLPKVDSMSFDDFLMHWDSFWSKGSNPNPNPHNKKKTVVEHLQLVDEAVLNGWLMLWEDNWERKRSTRARTGRSGSDESESKSSKSTSHDEKEDTIGQNSISWTQVMDIIDKQYFPSWTSALPHTGPGKFPGRHLYQGVRGIPYPISQIFLAKYGCLYQPLNSTIFLSVAESNALIEDEDCIPLLYSQTKLRLEIMKFLADDMGFNLGYSNNQSFNPNIIPFKDYQIRIDGVIVEKFTGIWTFYIDIGMDRAGQVKMDRDEKFRTKYCDWVHKYPVCPELTMNYCAKIFGVLQTST